MAAGFLSRSRHGTTFYFRRRVCQQIQPILQKTYLVTSLRTSDIREARIRARRLAVQTDRLFQYFLKESEMTHGNVAPREIQFNYMFEFGIADEQGPVKSVKVQTEPGNQADYEAANQAIQTILQSLGSAHLGTQAPIKPSGRALSIAIDEYLSSTPVSSGTLRAYETKLNYLKRYFGEDRDVLSINQVDFVEFSKQAPKDIPNPSTSNQYIKVSCSFLKWVRIRAGEQPLTTSTLTQKRTMASSEDRDPFSTEDLRKLFKNAIRYKETCPAKYWATLIIAFTGARLEEISQINVTQDLKQTSDGIWYFDVNQHPDEDGLKRKSLKKLSSARTIAIHSFLVKNGFIDFLMLQVKKGYTRPFESVWKPHSDLGMGGLKWNHKISKWGSKELAMLKKSFGLGEQKFTYFHSHRHTLNTLLATKGVSEEIRSAILGQQYGVGVNATLYTKLRSDPKISSEVLEEHLSSYVEMLEELKE